jgi:hypothetical protein
VKIEVDHIFNATIMFKSGQKGSREVPTFRADWRLKSEGVYHYPTGNWTIPLTPGQPTRPKYTEIEKKPDTPTWHWLVEPVE